jgi:hypothetical protein
MEFSLVRQLLRKLPPERLEALLDHAITNQEIEGYILTPDEIAECRRFLSNLASGGE